jgi:hypothetical protein
MERARLESAAANYIALRGLLMIPVGILIVIAAMSNLEWGPFRQLWVFWAAAAAAGAAALLILRHYNGTYGRVTPSRRARVKAGVATAVMVAITVVLMQTTWSLDLPISGGALPWAVVIVGQYVASGVRLRPYHLVVTGLLLIVGLAPIWGDVTPDNRINIGMILGGVAVTLVGIIDHIFLKRAFAPAADLDHDPNHGNADVDAQ